MRISRLLNGSLPFFRFMVNPIPGMPAIPLPLSATQEKMVKERQRIAALPADASRPSRQTKRDFDRFVAKRRRGALLKKAGSKRSFVRFL